MIFETKFQQTVSHPPQHAQISCSMLSTLPPIHSHARPQCLSPLTFPQPPTSPLFLSPLHSKSWQLRIQRTPSQHHPVNFLKGAEGPGEKNCGTRQPAEISVLISCSLAAPRTACQKSLCFNSSPIRSLPPFQGKDVLAVCWESREMPRQSSTHFSCCPYSSSA